LRALGAERGLVKMRTSFGLWKKNREISLKPQGGGGEKKGKNVGKLPEP